MITPPRRKWHPQASLWLENEALSKIFTLAIDLPSRKGDAQGGCNYYRMKAALSPMKENVAHHRTSTLASQI
jgi:hypothetical protein